MIPGSFDYQRAASIDDAIARLVAAGGGGKFIAGGHSLVPLMKLRLAEPAVLVDLGRIPGFGFVRERGDVIEIGAGTTHHELATSSLLRERCPALAEAAAGIGDQQVRNRGTIGGSLAHADPSADLPAVVVALDADVDVRGPEGSRTVDASSFFQGLMTVDLSPHELIVGIRIRPVRASAYAKLPQRASRYAVVGVAAALTMEGGVIREARVCVTGATSHATRLPAVESRLAGKAPTPAAIDEAAANAGERLADVNVDIHASEAYRRAMVAVFTKRALTAAASKT